MITNKQKEDCRGNYGTLGQNQHSQETAETETYLLGKRWLACLGNMIPMRTDSVGP